MVDTIKVGKSVEDYVNSVSYGEDATYIPSPFALEFVNFIKLVNGEAGEENLTPVLHYKMLDQLAGRTSSILNMLFRGSAKALALDTVVFTPNGVTTIASLGVGDFVLDRLGLPTMVTHKSKVFNKPTYRITLDDHRELVVCEDHLNIVERVTTGNVYREHVLTVPEILKQGLHYTRTKTSKQTTGIQYKWFIPKTPVVEYAETHFPIDPYTVGVILGDGSISKNTGYSRVHSHIDDVQEIIDYIPTSCSVIRHDKRRHSTVRFGLLELGSDIKTWVGTVNTYTKEIPSELLFGSVEQRLMVLRGLMDTDGTISKEKGTNPSFTSVSEKLAEGVATIVRGLGGRAKITKNCWDGNISYRVGISLGVNPFRLKRKANLWKPKEYKRIGIKSIEEIPSVPTQCIAVESDTQSFLVNGYTITHNTTLFGEYLFLYLGVYGRLPGFGQVDIALYVSDSIENGVKNMRKNLEFRWENSDFLRQYIPNIKFTDIRWQFTNADGKLFIVKGYGAQTGIRGAKEMGKRPTLAVLDDLISDEDARSPTVIKSVEDTVYKAVDYALHPTNNKVIWSGTPFNAKDPLYKAVESGAWAVNVYPVCEKFPCKREEFVGAWEDRFTYDAVKDKYDKALKAGKIDSFNQELMLRIMSDEDRLIQNSDISWYKRSTVLNNKGLFNFYITTDFATSERSSADYSVISVWAYTSNGDWLWIDGIVKRQLMSDNVNDLFRLAQMYAPQQVGIEISGQQGGFISWIQDEMLVRNIYFPLASEGNNTKPGIRPNTNKLVRFNIMVPLFKLNKIKFPIERKESEEMLECIDELSLAAVSGFKSKHDDFIDCISMLGSLTPWKPSKQSEGLTQDANGIWEEDLEDPVNSLDSYIF
jgi:phage terminase large subunit-like protein